MRDFRAWDCTCIGEIHDVSFEAVCQQFARSPEDYRWLAEVYSAAKDRPRLMQAWGEFGYSQDWDGDFLTPRDATRCRVIEVWRKESKPRYWCHDYNSGDVFKIEVEDHAEMVAAENARRMAQGAQAGMPADEIPLIRAEWMMDDYWYYYYLSPLGDILAEGETPYEHKSHPYVFKAYPFIDGEVHSFVGDVIDQQRYTNRLVTLYDWIMRASAKGVLLVPEDSIPKGMSPEDFAQAWVRFNGVVVFKPSQSGQLPQQVAANSTNIGISELLQVQLKFFEDISGVNGALQGKPGYSGMSAALYNQQTQNATTSLLDLLEVFNGFITEAAYKDVKNMQQFYDRKRVFHIAGRTGRMAEYDPQKIRNVEFDLGIFPSTATPAYRAMANDFLMKIWESGQITLRQMLETGEFPFADQLLQSLASQQEQLERGERPDGMPAELMARTQEGTDMEAVEKLYGAMRGS